MKLTTTLHGRWTSFRKASALVVLLAAAIFATGFTWPWERSPWPKSSETPVRELDFPTIEARVETAPWSIDDGFSFVAFGDQRALADGEWQAIIAPIAALSDSDPRILFVLDTGDIVDDGGYSDQFTMLRQILEPIDHLPYLVGVGNHELDNGRKTSARENTAKFLGYLDDRFSTERMYYRKDIGGTVFLFTDTNDLVYGDFGDNINPAEPKPGSRGKAQLRWLVEQLESEDVTSADNVIVVMHHPFIQSSKEHRKQALALWTMKHEGRSLPHILIDGGVDLILTGHTHTYECFLLEREDGRRMNLVNLSGRPRTSILWRGDGRREARDIAGKEMEWLAEAGWRELEGWRIRQTDAMVDDESNQFGLFSIDDSGGISLEVFFLDDDSPDGVRRGAPVELH